MGAVVTWLDFVLPPALLLFALLLSPLPAKVFGALANQQAHTSKGVDGQLRGDGDDSLSLQSVSSAGFVVPAQIHHARMLPSDATHQFRYPGLYLAFELHALEAGQLDCTPGFKWTGLRAHHNHAFHAKQHADRGRGEGHRHAFALTKLHPADFGRKVFPDVSKDAAHIISGSILLKLLFELRLREYIAKGPQDIDVTALIEGAEQPWQSQVGQVWAVAMPTVLGLGGFNPLTVYYVYRPAEGGTERGALWLAVLEVHNTFSERHIYVCEVARQAETGATIEKPGSNATDSASQDEFSALYRGYSHFWEFPRAFHVSPFNDRSGNYQLYLNDLWQTTNDLPTIDVRLLLMASKEEKRDAVDADACIPLQKKLMATLTSSQAQSPTLKTQRVAVRMTMWTLLFKIAAQPLDLFLPVARIMWEAAKLHWKKRLPVYMRPEPHGGAWVSDDDKIDGSDYSGEGWPRALNPVGARPKRAIPSVESSSHTAAKRAPSGGIFWNSESYIESTCRQAMERFFIKATQVDAAKTITVRTRNAEQPDVVFLHGTKQDIPKECCLSHGNDPCATKEESGMVDLTFYTLSSAIYVDLCLFPSDMAHLVGSRADRMWGVSSIEAYRNVMSSAPGSSKAADRTIRIYSFLARQIRTSYVSWALQQNYEADETSLRATSSLLQEAKMATHPLDAIQGTTRTMSGFSFRLLFALALHVVILRVMALVSGLLNIRYVRSPWAAVGDARKLIVQQKQ